MERHTESERDALVKNQLRHVQRGAVYVRRPTPPPGRQIVDVFYPSPSQKSSKPRSASPTPPRPVSTVPPRQKPAPNHQPVKRAKSKRRRLLPPAALYITAAIMVILGGWLTYEGLIANKRAADQIKELSDRVAAADGSDENAPPSTTPPSADAVRNYAVAPNLPKYIDIPSLSVHARILSLGIDSKGELKAPGNVYDAGWYNASAQPGQPGGMLIDGHVSSLSTKGVFYGLNKLKTGDIVTITRGDNKQFAYKVVSSETTPVDQVDMASLLVSPDAAKPGLSLISCIGDIVPGTNEFDKRIIIRAILAE